MPYLLSTVFMIYDGGRPELEPAINGMRRWIEANSNFSMPRNIKYIPATGQPHSDILNPWIVDWSEIPYGQIIFLLNASPTPGVAGGTWGVGPPTWGHFRDSEDVCAVIGASYDPWWNPFTGPDLGFPTGFEVMLVHEFKNAIDGLLTEPPQADGGGGLGFSKYDILNTYCPNEPYGCIDCTQFPHETERTECYRAFLDQITLEMYQGIGPYKARVGIPLAVGLIGAGLLLSRKRGKDGN